MGDPFYEKMTASYKVRQVLLKMWPTVYTLFNGLINLLAQALKEMIATAIRAIKG